MPDAHTPQVHVYLAKSSVLQQRQIHRYAQVVASMILTRTQYSTNTGNIHIDISLICAITNHGNAITGPQAHQKYLRKKVGFHPQSRDRELGPEALLDLGVAAMGCRARYQLLQLYGCGRGQTMLT